MQASWNSLEQTKLAVSLLTPVLVLILGVVINNSIGKADRATAFRSEIYKLIGHDLNDIYSYLKFVGSWKDLTPGDIIKRKRNIDRAMYTYRPFFSVELFSTYERFMEESFRPFGTPGEDAKIRTVANCDNGDRRIHGKNAWQPSWDACFTNENNDKAQQDAYSAFLQQLARDLKL